MITDSGEIAVERASLIEFPDFVTVACPLCQDRVQAQKTGSSVRLASHPCCARHAAKGRYCAASRQSFPLKGPHA